MKQQSQPLAEVFGHLITDQSDKANRYRMQRLCPFNNKVPNCTKDKAKNPLGVCSVYHNDRPAITCPIRFREDWLITGDAASFFFEEGATWSSLTEVRLNDTNGKSAGNVDVVLVAYDANGKVYDFGAIQTRGFSSCQELSSAQFLFNGNGVTGWSKKVFVALNRESFNVLLDLSPISKEDAEVAWGIYGLKLSSRGRYELFCEQVVYTKRPGTLEVVWDSDIMMGEFLNQLENKLEEAVV